MPYLEDLSLATRLFHSPDFSELLDAICDDDASDGNGGCDQMRPAADVAGGDAPINSSSGETARAADGTHARPLRAA